MMKAARLLQADVQNLRSISISTNRETRMLLVEGDASLDPEQPYLGVWTLQVGNRSLGSTEWDTLPLDEANTDNSQGERDISEGAAQDMPDISLASWDTLSGPGSGNDNAIVFSPRGWVSNPSEDFVDGFVTLRVVNKHALAQGYNQEARLKIARSGFARLEASESTTLPDNAVGSPGGTR